MKITVITKDDLRITYKGVIKYEFEDNVITISHTYGEYYAAYTDSYKFSDLKGIIINIKRVKDADKR